MGYKPLHQLYRNLQLNGYPFHTLLLCVHSNYRARTRARVLAGDLAPELSHENSRAKSRATSRAKPFNHGNTLKKRYVGMYMYDDSKENILKCAILSTYGKSNNNYKQFRSKLGSNSFIWYITTINKILLEACG